MIAGAGSFQYSANRLDTASSASHACACTPFFAFASGAVAGQGCSFKSCWVSVVRPGGEVAQLFPLQLARGLVFSRGTPMQF